jgi:hypothetical protein
MKFAEAQARVDAGSIQAGILSGQVKASQETIDRLAAQGHDVSQARVAVKGIEAFKAAEAQQLTARQTIANIEKREGLKFENVDLSKLSQSERDTLVKAGYLREVKPTTVPEKVVSPVGDTDVFGMPKIHLPTTVPQEGMKISGAVLQKMSGLQTEKAAEKWWSGLSAKEKAAALVTAGTIDVGVAGGYFGAKLFGTKESQFGYPTEVYKTLNIEGAAKQTPRERFMEGLTKVGTGTTAQATATMIGLGAATKIATGGAAALGATEAQIALGERGAGYIFGGVIARELGTKVVEGKPGTALAELGLIGATMPVGAIGARGVTALSGLEEASGIRSLREVIPKADVTMRSEALGAARLAARETVGKISTEISKPSLQAQKVTVGREQFVDPLSRILGEPSLQAKRTGIARETISEIGKEISKPTQREIALEAARGIVSDIGTGVSRELARPTRGTEAIKAGKGVVSELDIALRGELKKPTVREEAVRAVKEISKEKIREPQFVEYPDVALKTPEQIFLEQFSGLTEAYKPEIITKGRARVLTEIAREEARPIEVRKPMTPEQEFLGQFSGLTEAYRPEITMRGRAKVLGKIAREEAEAPIVTPKTPEQRFTEQFSGVLEGYKPEITMKGRAKITTKIIREEARPVEEARPKTPEQILTEQLSGLTEAYKPEITMKGRQKVISEIVRKETAAKVETAAKIKSDEIRLQELESAKEAGLKMSERDKANLLRLKEKLEPKKVVTRDITGTPSFKFEEQLKLWGEKAEVKRTTPAKTEQAPKPAPTVVSKPETFLTMKEEPLRGAAARAKDIELRQKAAERQAKLAEEAAKGGAQMTREGQIVLTKQVTKMAEPEVKKAPPRLAQKSVARMLEIEKEAKVAEQKAAEERAKQETKFVQITEEKPLEVRIDVTQRPKTAEEKIKVEQKQKKGFAYISPAERMLQAQKATRIDMMSGLQTFAPKQFRTQVSKLIEKETEKQKEIQREITRPAQKEVQKEAQVQTPVSKPIQALTGTGQYLYPQNLRPWKDVNWSEELQSEIPIDVPSFVISKDSEKEEVRKKKVKPKEKVEYKYRASPIFGGAEKLFEDNPLKSTPRKEKKEIKIKSKKQFWEV